MPEPRSSSEALSGESLEAELSADQDTPYPMTEVLCAVCRLPWDLHRELAERRLGWVEEMGEDGVDSFTDDQVTLRDCVQLLLLANPGLPG